jgi:hypothetical protein
MNHEIKLYDIKIINFCRFLHNCQYTVHYYLEITIDNDEIVYCWKTYEDFYILYKILLKQYGQKIKHFPKEYGFERYFNKKYNLLIHYKIYKLNLFLQDILKNKNLQWGIAIDNNIIAYKRRVKEKYE